MTLLGVGMLVFYDTETSGTSVRFDQICQYAAIRTDEYLNEIDRFEIRSKLSPHIIPAPMALHTTGMSVADLTDPSHPSHYAMVAEVRAVLTRWGTSTFLGWNSIRFDEEILRSAFWACLHPPYLTNTAGNGRGDALNLVRAFSLLHPDALVIPLSDKGKPTFKLDRLGPANGLSFNAHDAMADVQATISMCRMVRDRDPGLWTRFLAFAHKAPVNDFTIENDAFIAFETFGARTVPNVVTRLGVNSGQGTLIYALDLACDLDELAGLDDVKLLARVKKSPRPIRRIKSNTAPILLGLDDAPVHTLGDFTRAEWLERAEKVRQDPEFVQRLLRAAEAAETVYAPSEHVEEQIYEGFVGRQDERLMASFHTVPWEHRVEMIRQFQDVRLKRLARRLVYFERPDLLSAADRDLMAAEMRRRLVGEGHEAPPWLTVDKALAELDEALAKVGADVPALAGYREHLAGLGS